MSSEELTQHIFISGRFVLIYFPLRVCVGSKTAASGATTFAKMLTYYSIPRRSRWKNMLFSAGRLSPLCYYWPIFVRCRALLDFDWFCWWVVEYKLFHFFTIPRRINAMNIPALYVSVISFKIFISFKYYLIIRLFYDPFLITFLYILW